MNQAFIAGFVAGFSLCSLVSLIGVIALKKSIERAASYGSQVDLYGKAYVVVPKSMVGNMRNSIATLKEKVRLRDKALSDRARDLQISRSAARSLARKVRELGGEA